MKRINSIIVTSLFAILAGGGPLVSTASAQYDPAITVDIPFAFSADGHDIAAGTYQLQLISNDFLMSVRNVNTGNENLIPVHPDQDRKVESKGRLIFQVCEGHNYLTQIRVPGTNLFSETMNGPKQKDAEAEACSNGDSTTVALR
jgi:hypothetical protein